MKDTASDTTIDVQELGKANLTGFEELAAGQIDTEWMIDILFRLLRTPSPSGRTDAVMQYIGDIVSDLGLESRVTRQGTLVVELPGETETVDRALVVHADTIGCMVAGLKDNGRLQVVPIGTFSARFAEGARVQIITEQPDEVYTGTILPLKSSGHAYGDEIDDQEISWDHVEVRVDERVSDKAGLEELGIEIGNTVALLSVPMTSRSGYINARHLDGKAGVAIALAAAKSVKEGRLRLPHRTSIMVTIFEEVGHGASSGVSEDVAELVSIDNAVCAPGQNSIEYGVTIPLKDLHGPFDYHLTRKLIRLAQKHGLPVARDIFKFYRSDVAAALEAGAGARAALVAFGLDASHGWERTHVESLVACADLITLWLQTPLTMGEWDKQKVGPLENFPSQRQPMIEEQPGDRQHEGEISNVPRYHPEFDADGDSGSVPAEAAQSDRTGPEGLSSSDWADS
ncbi:osmoprotectant NAGGN system M42 family peptidase [Brevibacterium daeguense]|uniref:Osmoprotectant NAGGN system M42 family peptidase n=1 Tax=Brevibacterium daeguense TaxID=909936 RepID=A0ABP8ELG8_9MICO|nr:osmoprotectant NAGGN system M42 family peptidase [Brevibacterium daeguense]